ncbi:MAG TPA: 50S ribosomal protein L4 [Iamia sp.]
MPKIDVLDASGKKTSTTELDDAVFGIEPNGAVLHQVVTAQLAARRAGTQSTKTRAEVRGGGAKPWKQKGTGRARAGSTRSPMWTGGGVALGPKPRSYSQRTPKKMVRLALRSALSDRAADGKVKIVDLGFDAPSTKQAVEALGKIGVEGKVLLVVAAEDTATWKSFRNLTDVHILVPGELNAYDVLVSDWVVFTAGTVPTDSPLSRGGHADAEDTPSLEKEDAS